MIVPILASFTATSLAALAVGLTVRDVRGRRTPTDRRLAGRENTEPLAPIGVLPSEKIGAVDGVLQRLLDESGSRLDRTTALALIVGSGLVVCAATLLIADHLLAAAGGMFAGMLVPILWLCVTRIVRYAKMEKSLPETLDLLADGVRSGRSLEKAACLVAEEMTGPLADEFSYCASQLRLGQSPVNVLARMVRRVPVPEFKVFAIAMVVHRQTGGNLARLTDRLASAARDRQEFTGHLRAVSSGSRLSALGLVVGSLLGVAVLATMQPEYLKSFATHASGPTLIAIACCLQLLGAIWVWRVLRVRY